jgi:hypothetical protein
MLIASAAASLILAGAVAARANDQTGGGMVSCHGVNACKGQGACAGPESTCKGMNACKGKGVVQMSAADCTKQGGKVVEQKKE